MWFSTRRRLAAAYSRSSCLVVCAVVFRVVRMVVAHNILWMITHADGCVELKVGWTPVRWAGLVNRGGSFSLVELSAVRPRHDGVHMI